MDTITQGLLGAAAAQALLQRRLGPRAWLVGALGGMAPDLDIVIRSGTNPLIGWEYHRHFTHSLLFVPFGGALVGVPLALRDPDRARRIWVVAGATVGLATHALLDLLTTYGTLLFWPFSRARLALNWIAIIDPLYTMTLLLGVVLAARWGRARPARQALVISTLYLLFGGVQHARAHTAATALAESRGHAPDRVDVMPVAPFHIVWRSIYATNGRIFVDGVRTSWVASPRVREGGSVQQVTRDDVPPDMRPAFEKFEWFTRGWVSRSPADPSVLGDARYAAGPVGLEPMWGIRHSPGSSPPIEGVRQRGSYRKAIDRRLRGLWPGE